MKKIPTIFKRGPDFKVINEITPGCDWVFNGEGVATEKLDGTNVQITVENGQAIKLEKRRNPTKEEKARGEIDAAIMKEITLDLIEVFPNHKERTEWLNTPNDWLRDQPPTDFINPDYIFKFLEVLEREKIARRHGCCPARKGWG